VIEAWVYWRLVSDPGTAAWFGFRVTPVIGEQVLARDENGDVLPYATYRVTDAQYLTDLEHNKLDGEKSVAIEVWVMTYEGAKAAAAAVQDALHRATESGFGCNVHVSLEEGEQDDAGIPVNGKDKPLYSVMKTFRILAEI
jgi:hypothetical protein